MTISPDSLSDNLSEKFGLAAGRQPDHVLDDVKYSVGPSIDEDDVMFKYHSFPDFRQRRQTTVQIGRKRLQTLLQPRRKPAILV